MQTGAFKPIAIGIDQHPVGPPGAARHASMPAVAKGQQRERVVAGKHAVITQINAVNHDAAGLKARGHIVERAERII